MIMLKKFVITGGPCTGKTSVINELEKEFKVIHETARQLLNKGFQGRSFEFYNAIFEKQLENEEKLRNFREVVFLDRGIPDILAYFKLMDFKVPFKLKEKSKLYQTNYEIIFLLDFVPYIKDEIRKENQEEALVIHNMLYEFYDSLGYRIIRVPLMSIKERVEYIKRFVLK